MTIRRLAHGSAVRSAIVLGITLALLSCATGCGKSSPDRAAPPPTGAPADALVSPKSGAAAGGAAQGAATTPPAREAGRRALEVHAEMDVTVDKAEGAARIADLLARTASEKGGFVASGAVGEGTPDGLSAHVVVRVPATEIGAVRAALVSGGDGATITRESESATDVTEALADLDARLRNAREEERRLLELLDKHTGSLADVLTTEHALSEVRERIEKLEAEQRVAQGRVDLASVDVRVRTKAAAIAMTPPTTFEALRAAGKDGVQAAEEVTVTLLGVALRGGPTVLLFAVAAWGLFAAVRRLVRARFSAASSV